MAELFAKSDPGAWLAGVGEAGEAGGAPFSADALLGDLAKEPARSLAATPAGCARRAPTKGAARVEDARGSPARRRVRGAGAEDIGIGDAPGGEPGAQ